MTTLRVFLSSTFRDMGEERRELVGRVFPELRRRWEKRGIHVVEVDLRWGVPDEMASLEVCLDEVHACRPLFVCFLGHMYGSVVPPEVLNDECVRRFPWLSRDEHAGKSYTELEIIHAALRADGPEMDCLFYLRDEAYSRVTAESTGLFEKQEASRVKLQALKDDLCARGLCPRPPYRSARELGLWVEMELDHLIARRAAEMTPGGGWAQRQGRMWVGEMAVMEELCTAALEWWGPKHRGASSQGVVVHGPSGSGKSTLLAGWAACISGSRRKVIPVTPHETMMDAPLPSGDILLVSADAEPAPVAHLLGMQPVVLCLHGEAGGTPEEDAAQSWAPAAMTLLRFIRDRWAMQMPLPPEEEPMRILYALPAALARVPADVRLLLLIDGAPTAAGSGHGAALSWLPAALPAQIFVAASVSSEGAASALVASRRWLRVKTGERMPARLLQMMVKARLMEHGKRLARDSLLQMVTLLGKVPPRWTELVLADLRQVPTREEMPGRISELECAAGVPGDLGRLLLEAAGRQTRETILWQAVGLLMIAKTGLMELELRVLLGEGGTALPAAEWSPVYLRLRDWLQRGEGLLKPMQELCLAWQSHQKAMPAEEAQREREFLWKRLVNHFVRLGPGNARALEQVAWLYRRSAGLPRLLSEPSWLGGLWKHRRAELWQLSRLMEVEPWLAAMLSKFEEAKPPATALAAIADLATESPRLFMPAHKAASQALEEGETEAILVVVRGLVSAGRRKEAFAVLAERLPEIVESEDSSLGIRCLLAQAEMMLRSGEGDAMPLLTQAVARAEQACEPRPLMDALLQLGSLALTGPKPADALPFFAEQERVALVVASDADVVDARLGRAQCLRYLNGRRAEAEALLRETVPLALQSGSARQHQAVMGVLVEVLRDASKLGEATEWLMRRRKIIDELDDLPLRVEATMQHAGICRDRGDTETAALYYQQARSLALHLGLSGRAQECLHALESLGGA